MEKKIQATIVYWGFLRIMGKNMEATIVYWGCIYGQYRVYRVIPHFKKQGNLNTPLAQEVGTRAMLTVLAPRGEYASKEGYNFMMGDPSS